MQHSNKSDIEPVSGKQRDIYEACKKLFPFNSSMNQSKKQARRQEADNSVQKSEKLQDLATKIFGRPKSPQGVLLLFVLQGRTTILPDRKREKEDPLARV